MAVEFGRKLVGRTLILGLIILSMAPLFAQELRMPTFEYYGRVLSAEEYLRMVNDGIEFHCVQIPSAEALHSDRAPIDYTCFHTLDEADAYSRDVVPAEWDRLARESGTSTSDTGFG